MLALLYFRNYLPPQIARFIFMLFSHARSSIVERYGSDMEGLIVWGPAAILQASAAGIAAGSIARLGALHGLFAAFIAGLVMVVGDYLLIGIHQSLNETLALSPVFLGSGALLAVPVVLAVSGIAGWLRDCGGRKLRNA